MAIKDFLLQHEKEDPVSFHMPGHKGSRIFRENGYEDFLNKLVDLDITEISGADNLFQAEGIIKETMERYASSYDAQKSYLLTNGSSAGIIASMLASVKEGGSIVVARNCHKSVFNGLELGRINPVYAYPKVVEEYGIAGEVTPEEIARCLDNNPEAEAVILPSPNYYGIASDIEKITEEVHQRGKILIVDQAHGAHLKMFSKLGVGNLPKSAEEQGADLVINSIHKTLCSFTQSALLNVMTDSVKLELIEDELQKLESSSPSYMLMAGLDVNIDMLERHGEELLGKWNSNLEYFYEEARKIDGLNILKPDNFDYTKINIDMGISGARLEKMLMERGVYPELVSGNILMCMSGIGNVKEDYARLLEALKDISEKVNKVNKSCEKKLAYFKKLKMDKVPKESEWIRIDEAAGRVCAKSVTPYPPGIPIVCPGEILDNELLEYAKELRVRGEKLIGIDDELRVCVGK